MRNKYEGNTCVPSKEQENNEKRNEGENNYKLLKFTNMREFLINELKYAFRQATLECEKGYLSQGNGQRVSDIGSKVLELSNDPIFERQKISSTFMLRSGTVIIPIVL